MLVKNASLKNFNTMKVDVSAAAFTTVKNAEQIIETLSQNAYKNILVIGSGSNILFTEDFAGLIIKNEITGIEILTEDDRSITVKAGAGVNWHNFVEYAVKNKWSGIENLSLIPGTVGAAPVQNIGAYGQEIKDVLLSVSAIELQGLKRVTFLKDDCGFSYRNSIFKQESKNKHIITSATFELKKTFIPLLSYPALAKAIEQKNILEPSLNQVMETVVEIRQSKLPDYFTLSNCGSFFTNPFLPKPGFDVFIAKNSEAPFYPFNNGYKLSAGWLIEQCGWKGKRIGNVGCYEHHALVIVNYNNASGKEIYDFSCSIRDSVYKKFGVELEYEVNII